MYHNEKQWRITTLLLVIVGIFVLLSFRLAYIQIIVAVLVEEGGEGTVAVAPVVKKVLEAYFAEPNYNP